MEANRPAVIARANVVKWIGIVVTSGPPNEAKVVGPAAIGPVFAAAKEVVFAVAKEVVFVVAGGLVVGGLVPTEVLVPTGGLVPTGVRGRGDRRNRS